MGELNVEKQRITWRKFREMGSRNYSSSIVANSRSSLYLRNMVELVVDFTRDQLYQAKNIFRREVGSRDYSSSIVANSRSSLYLRNMVELVVDFTGSGILKQSKYLDIGEYSSGPYEHLVD